MVKKFCLVCMILLLAACDKSAADYHAATCDFSGYFQSISTIGVTATEEKYLNKSDVDSVSAQVQIRDDYVVIMADNQKETFNKISSADMVKAQDVYEGVFPGTGRRAVLQKMPEFPAVLVSFDDECILDSDGNTAARYYYACLYDNN